MTIFNNEENTNTPIPQTNNNSEVPATEALAILVGEGKRYATVEDLAKAKLHADEFIEQLKNEGHELRQDLDQRLNAEEMLEEIKKTRDEITAKAAEAGAGATTPGLDKEAISALVSDSIAESDRQKVSEQNILTVDTKMKELYGDKATEVLKKKAAELNVGVDFLKGVAEKSPDAFFNTIGVSTPKGTTTPGAPTGGTNSEALRVVNEGSQVEANTWEHFEKIRKENPRRYFSTEVQNKLFEARKNNPEGFYKKP